MKWLIIAEIEGDKPTSSKVSKLKEDVESLILESASDIISELNIRAVSCEHKESRLK